MLEAARFDAVITDMRLPDGLGLDLLQRMRSAAAPRALHRDHRLRLGRERGRGAEGRRLRLPDQAGGPASSSAPWWPRRSRTAAPPRRARPRRRAPRAGRARADARRRRRRPRCERLVGDSEPMRQVKERIAKVARSMAPVLVRGESGTGKELVARAIHACSQRADGPFVAVNCGAIPENLLEAEFFGYRKGSYTGATEDREGYFQAAQRRHAVPRRDRRPAAGDADQAAARDPGARGAPARLDAGRRRSTCASSAPPTRTWRAEVQAGRFRQDLYYRLNVIEIRVPPLRERREDLPALCAGAAGAHRAATPGMPVPALSPPMRCSSCCAHPLARQRARAREPAAPRGGAVRRRGDRSATTSGCPTRLRSSSDRAPSSMRASRAAVAAAPRRAPTPHLPERPARPTSTSVSARSWCARSSATASTAPPPAPAWACRCARCATASRGWASRRPAATSPMTRRPA